MLHIIPKPKNLIKNLYQNPFKIKQCCVLCCDPYVHQYMLMDVWVDSDKGTDGTRGCQLISANCMAIVILKASQAWSFSIDF